MVEGVTPPIQPLRILLLEDNPADAKLCIRTLRSAGIQFQEEVCRSSIEFMERVRAGAFNLILGDYRLPDWTGLEAIRWLRSSGFTTPFVLVTGTLGDELAIECIKAGASDYVLKENLERLPIVVQRALDEQQLREQRDRAEEELRTSEEQYRLLFEANPNPMWVYSSEDLRFLAVNETAVGHYGHSRGEFLSMAVKDVYPEEELTRFLQCQKMLLDSPMTEREVWKHRKKDGSIIDVEVTSAPILFRGLKARLVLASEITDRLRAEAAFRESTESYRSVVEGAPYGIFQAEQGGRVSMANPALATMLGYDSPADLLHRNISSDIYWNPAECRQNLQSYQAALGGVVSSEARWNRKDGSPITVRLSGRAIQSIDPPRLFFEVFVENITEQRLLEQQFRQAQKMEAIGRLAGGVAHDFNNLLMIILSYAQLIEDSATDPQKVTRHALEIRQAAYKAALVTKQLLAFSRRQIQELRVLNISAVVTEFAKMLPPLLGEDIDLAIKPTQEECLVYADRGQIEQVIMNLVVNARDAMPNGGRLTIETANVDLDEQYSRQHGAHVSAGRYAMFAITDDGQGMDAQTQARIFEPFFTTKEPGKGTGLGLATVYGIVKQSNGFVWVYSEIGKGTTFKIYLPHIQLPITPDLPSPAEDEPIPGGNETILIVEDEARLRAANRLFLEAKGYTILEASNGAEALDIFATYSQQIHLVLTDIVMPGMSGTKLGKSVLATRPDIRVIYMSGYPDQTVDAGALAADSIFLQKPFTLAHLAKTIRATLNSVPKK
jgi:two-component system cell cycle sensor histidine kinase/response regulator CckA